MCVVIEEPAGLNRVLHFSVWSLIVVLAGSLSAYAGVPRGVVLIASEQDADADTGITIARGNAEISIAQRAVLGAADTIELNPVAQKILFKGHAVVTVGRARYQSEFITCTLDFYSCAPSSAVQAAPVAESAAVTNPR
jgi:hypothetical protein